MLGLQKGTVRLEPPTEEWRKLFIEERNRILEAIGEITTLIEHIGSTSIGNIAAKPIIDIAVAIKKLEDGERCIAPLEKLGYVYRGENGIAGRFYFVKGEPRTHHLHMVGLSGDVWRNHLLFRDYLRANPAVAAAYETLKMELAERNSGNREAYLIGKTLFIEDVLRKANFRG